MVVVCYARPSSLFEPRCHLWVVVLVCPRSTATLLRACVLCCFTSIPSPGAKFFISFGHGTMDSVWEQWSCLRRTIKYYKQNNMEKYMWNNRRNTYKISSTSTDLAVGGTRFNGREKSSKESVDRLARIWRGSWFRRREQWVETRSTERREVDHTRVEMCAGWAYYQ